MKKENLVLVQSYPTNSVLLQGLIEFLDEYYNVYFVDLPGFRKNIPPLKKISIKEYSKFLDNFISKLNIKDYIVGGISFGFAVVNNAELDHRCTGILAIEPYIDNKSLKIKGFKKVVYKTLLWSISNLGIYNKLWKSSLLQTYYEKISKYPLRRIEIIFEEEDPKTFFRTGSIILNQKKDRLRHKLPCVVIINPKDNTINTDYLVSYFFDHLDKVKIVKTKVGHYPRTVTKKYFERQFSGGVFNDINNFFRENEK